MADKRVSTPVKKTEAGELSQFSRPSRSKSLTRAKASEQSPSRLPSLRGPRDLTLGGVKKKTFAPNIPVRKDRIKTEFKEEAKPTIKSNRPKRERSRDGRGRGRGRGGFQRADIIQSHSIFESGPSAEASNRGRESLSSVSEPVAQIQKPTIKKESIDLAQEKSESDEVMRKLDEGNTSLIADLQNDEQLKPVTLPLFPTDTKMKKIKSEPDSKTHLKQEKPSICADAFRNSSKDGMLLIQIPDTVPGVPLSDGSNVMVKQEPGTSASIKKEVTEETEETNNCSIDQLSEGRIGKLQIMKSGKCRLVLGKVRLDLKMGTPTTFAEELVSIRLPPEGSPESSKGHMTVLGNVERKLICVPDMESLIGFT